MVVFHSFISLFLSHFLPLAKLLRSLILVVCFFFISCSNTSPALPSLTHGPLVLAAACYLACWLKPLAIGVSGIMWHVHVLRCPKGGSLASHWINESPVCEQRAYRKRGRMGVLSMHEGSVNVNVSCVWNEVVCVWRKMYRAWACVVLYVRCQWTQPQ